jgi:hypothetical protein
MQLKITIECDNAAFTDASGVECCRILRKLSHLLESEDVCDGWRHALVDLNGNRVGEARVVGKTVVAKKQPTGVRSSKRSGLWR